MPSHWIYLIKKRPQVFAAIAVSYSIIAVLITSFYTYQRAQNVAQELFAIERKELALNWSMMEKLTQELNVYSEFNLLFKANSFNESWANDNERLEVMRLIESAKFAASKDDLDYALEKLGESQSIRDTLSAHYEKGRLHQRNGDVNKAIQEWQQLITMDEDNEYPDIRFYTSILLHVIGDREESKRMLQAYLRE